MRRRPALSLRLSLLAAGLLLGSCSDYRIVTTPKPVAGTVHLPPIGFNHQYGENPVAARDGFSMERQFFAENIYWEVFLFTQPAQTGFVNLGGPSTQQAARHKVTGVILTVATEDPTTINRFLASPGTAGQEAYAEGLLQEVIGFGYDSVSTAQVRIYFGELYEYANLAWTRAGGYSFDVLLKGYGQVQGETPLPTPQTPTTLPPTPATTAP